MTAPRPPRGDRRLQRWIAAAALLALVGCGVEGPPQAPSPRTGTGTGPDTGTGIGVGVTGEARIGVAGRL